MSEGELRFRYEQTLELFSSWAQELVYRYGVLRGVEYANRPNYKGSVYHDETAFKDYPFRARWLAGNGCLKLQITNHTLLNWQLQRYDTFQVFNRNDIDNLPVEFTLHACHTIENVAHMFFLDYELPHSPRFCESGLCDPQRHVVTFGNGLRVAQFHRMMCRRVGDKWVCDECVDRLSLGALVEQSSPSATPAQHERAKVSAQLRFRILERDGFRCRACGRSPREHNVKLHVDHIMPVSQGGKTTDENLHTLCEDCNLGKSDKIVPQMEAWD